MPTQVQDKIIDTVVPVKTPYWVAIIYNPKKESKEYDLIESVDYNDNKKPISIHMRQIMLPPQDIGNNSGGPSLDWLELRPGANVNVLYSKWEQALQVKTVKPLVGLSIEPVAYSSVEDETPGYRHFTSPEAIRLIRQTTASLWIDEWMTDETRAEVIKAANERKAYLETELAKRIS